MSLSRQSGITLAICTYNGRDRIKSTLTHILVQDNPQNIRWELLLIDNASTDSTSEFVLSLWPKDRLHQLRIVREEKLGAIHARNRAIEEARYVYLSYVDDDNWISSNWVAEVFNIFETFPTVGLISCPSTAHLPGPPPSYFEGLKGWLAIGKQSEEEGLIPKRPVYFWTAGLSLRLTAFEPLASTSYIPCLTGRFGKQTNGGEDHELCLTVTLLDWDVYYTRQISFVHDIPNSRLTVSYLEKLIRNGSKSNIILEIYKNEYERKANFNPYLLLFRYIHELLNCMLKYGLKYVIGLAETPLHPNRIGYLAALGRLQGYLIYFEQIALAQRNVTILRQLASQKTKGAPSVRTIN